MKQITLIMLLMTSIHSAPDWVPENKKHSYDLIVSTAKRMMRILRAKATYSKCKVENEKLVITLTRGDLDTVMELQIDGLKSCKAENGNIELGLERDKPSFMQCLSNTGIGFGAGFIGGIATCAAIK